MFFILFVMACTKNDIVRSGGGSATLHVQCGQKVETVTWKGNSLWLLTSTPQEDWEPRVLRFKEKSAFGAIEGEYIIEECRK